MESIPNRSPIIFGIRIIFFVYLDDHKIYTSGDSIKKAVQELMRKTEKVTEWYKVNLLKANSSVDLKLFKKELVDQLLLQIDDQEVKSLGKRTILKVIIEDELTFSEPIRNISKRDSQTFRVFLRLSDIISCFAKLQLYKSTILTHVMYPVSVVQAGLHRAQQINRQSALETAVKENTDRIPFTLTFHPHKHAVESIIFKNFKLLQSYSEIGTIFSQLPLISFKRDKNISNFLVRSSFQTNDQSGTFKYARSRCKTCPFIYNVEKLSVPKRSIRITDHFTCTSANVI